MDESLDTPLDRLKWVIDSIKKEEKLTNALISIRLGYRSETYVSEILGGSKPINDIFLERLGKITVVDPEWIKNGGSVRFKPKTSQYPYTDDMETTQLKDIPGELNNITVWDYVTLLRKYQAAVDKISVIQNNQEETLVTVKQMDRMLHGWSAFFVQMLAKIDDIYKAVDAKPPGEDKEKKKSKKS